MIIVFFAILIVFTIAVGIYLYFYLKRMADFFHININIKKVKIIIAVITVIISAITLNVWSMYSVIVLHIVTISLIMEVINIFIRKKHKWALIYKSGVIPLVLTMIIFGYGYYNMRHVVKTEYTIYTEKNIRDKGYSIALISDLHYGSVMNKEQLQKYCNEISSLKTDMVILCGDIVDENTKLKEMEEAIEVLGTIESNYGNYYVYGNHDKNIYRSKPSYTKDQLDKALEGSGINILQDECVDINNDFVIVGRDDAEMLQNDNREDIKSLLKDIDDKKFILLLDHQPCELKENNAARCDLMLSGHTHGGQIWPVGLLSEKLKINEMNYGYKKMSNMQIIVSSGICGWAYPVRTECKSEYVIINIENENI